MVSWWMICNFQFKDGSVYEEIMKFTQRGKFRLVSDQVEQRERGLVQAGERKLD
jgi:hypothetical protein